MQCTDCVRRYEISPTCPPQNACACNIRDSMVVWGVASLPQYSRVAGPILILGHYLCGVLHTLCVLIGVLRVLGFPPTSQEHAYIV